LSVTTRSYFSIFTKDDTTASALTTNPFKESTHSSYSYTSVLSSDISYSSSTGKITFGSPGEYLVIYDTSVIVSDATNVRARFWVNGSVVYTSEAVEQATSLDPIHSTFHTIITINSGDYLEATITTDDTATAIVQEGASLVVLKANGDYANLLYTAGANAGGTGGAEFNLFDSNESGTVAEKSKNITYTASTGKLTPDNTKTCLMLSTLIAVGGANGNIKQTLQANDSALDNIHAHIHTTDMSPKEMSYGFMKELTAAQTAFVSVEGIGTVQAKKGTSFSVFDISNNGTNPSGYLSLTANVDSDFLGDSGGKTCFRDGNWPSSTFASTVRAGAIDGSTGITFTASNGRFTFSNAGRYFILWSFCLSSVTTGTATVKVNVNGVKEYGAPWLVDGSYDPYEKTVCLILDAKANDYFSFAVQLASGEGGDAKYKNGTAISIFKVDDYRLTDDVSQRDLIDNDFTLNKYAIDSLSTQHDRQVDQVPFILGTPGPLSLRNRLNAPSTKQGDKKN